MSSIEQHDEAADTTYQKTTVVSADMDTVWEFYDDVDELRVLTPDWVGLRITKVTDENGELVKVSYHVGNRIHLESQPLNCGWLPGIEWVVEITDRHIGERERYFVDEQVGDRGPYETWRHTHRFVDLSEGTLIHDKITTSGGLPLTRPILAGMLGYRHWKTRKLVS